MARRVIGELVAKLEMDSTDFVRDARGAEEATSNLSEGMRQDLGSATQSVDVLRTALFVGLGTQAVNSLKGLSTQIGKIGEDLVQVRSNADIASRVLNAMAESQGVDVLQAIASEEPRVGAGGFRGRLSRLSESVESITKRVVSLKGAFVAVAAPVVAATAVFVKLNNVARQAGQSLNEMRNQAFGVSVGLE